MDNIYHHAPTDTQQPRVYNGGYLETPYAASRPPPSSAAHEPAQPDHTAPHWTPTQGYDGHPYGFRCDFPPTHGGGGFGGPPPYGFDPSVPPPPFGCPPPVHFPSAVTAAPIHPFNSGAASNFEQFNPQFRPYPQTARYDLDPSQNQQRAYGDFYESRALLGRTNRDRGPGAATRPEDEAALQRRQDLQWVGRFLQGRDKTPKTPEAEQPTPETPQVEQPTPETPQVEQPTPETPQAEQPPPNSSAPDPRAALYRAAELVSRLAKTCDALRNSVENECVWTDSYLMALKVKSELQEELQTLSDAERLGCLKAKLARVAKRRARRLRAKTEFQIEQKLREDRIAEKDAAINKWRLQEIQRVEEKKKERELKLAADSVLCEVRKKQADVKRMQDILRSLEKLRRLRKEAALRKGINTEHECDDAFSSRLEQLRCVMMKRTAVYSAEEKALMVMLEGEQEEERRREQEKRIKKERERHLQRKRRVTAMLFGEDLPAGSVLHPYKEYYTQAERSLHALLEIRRGWDTFVVPADHPDGSPVSQSWVLPDAPSDPAWASALHSADTE